MRRAARGRRAACSRPSWRSEPRSLGAQGGRRAPAHGQGAVLRPQVRGGAPGLAGGPGARRGPDAATAAYWIARCSESLGEHERALKEYGAFLAARPADRTLAEEARTSRVGLAARLYKAGAKQHLRDPDRGARRPEQDRPLLRGPPARRPGREAGQPAVPVLKRIVADEKDEDLVERAKLGLLRLDPTRPGARRRRLAAPPRGRSATRAGSACASTRRAAQAPRSRSTCRGAGGDRLQEPARRGAGRAAEEGLRRRQLLGPAAEARAHRDHRPSRATTGERIQIWLE